FRPHPEFQPPHQPHHICRKAAAALQLGGGVVVLQDVASPTKSTTGIGDRPDREAVMRPILIPLVDAVVVHGAGNRREPVDVDAAISDSSATYHEHLTPRLSCGGPLQDAHRARELTTRASVSFSRWLAQAN